VDKNKGHKKSKWIKKIEIGNPSGRRRQAMPCNQYPTVESNL
jgi:hypothetical protein